MAKLEGLNVTVSLQMVPEVREWLMQEVRAEVARQAPAVIASMSNSETIRSARRLGR